MIRDAFDQCAYIYISALHSTSSKDPSCSLYLAAVLETMSCIRSGADGKLFNLHVLTESLHQNHSGQFAYMYLSNV